ncbi:MAG: hypothetical protein OEO82_14285, partial [Gammaproteobacteria bacterium]|nr:hypothetical protein [Gammaproteobacteria bacterium]
MLPPAQLLSPDLTKASLQAPDNNGFFGEATQLEASFADILYAPLLAGEAEPVLLSGEQLPPGGSALPGSAGDALTDSASGFFEPLEEISALQATPDPVVTPAMMPSPAEPVGTAFVTPLVSPAANAMDPDANSDIAVDDGELAETRITGLEKASEHGRERSGHLPFMRSATQAEQIQLAAAANAADSVEASDDLSEVAKPDVLQRAAQSATEQALPRVAPRHAADGQPGLQPVSPTVSGQAVQGESLDGAAKPSGPAAPGPAQAGFVDAPQVPGSNARTASP